MEDCLHRISDFFLAFGAVDLESLAVDHDLMVLSEFYLPPPLLLQS